MFKKTIVIFSLMLSMVLLSACGSKTKLDYVYYTDGNENDTGIMYTKSVVSKEFLTDYYFKQKREKSEENKSKESLGLYTISVYKKNDSLEKELFKWNVDINADTTVTENQKEIINGKSPYIFLTISNSTEDGSFVDITYVSGMSNNTGSYLFEGFSFHPDLNKPIRVNLMDDLVVKINKAK